MNDVERHGAEVDDLEPVGVGQHPLDRRRVLGGIALGGAAAWAVPTVLSMDAAAAASAPPLACAGCGANSLTNPGAEVGMTGWSSTGATPFASLLYSAVAGILIPPPGSGTRYFSAGTTGGTLVSASMNQLIAVGSGCIGKPFTFSGWFLAVGTAGGTLRASATFFQGATPLGDGGAGTITRSTIPFSPPFSTTFTSVNGTVPALADSVRVTVDVTIPPSASPGGGFADLMDLTIGC